MGRGARRPRKQLRHQQTDTHRGLDRRGLQYDGCHQPSAPECWTSPQAEGHECMWHVAQHPIHACLPHVCPVRACPVRASCVSHACPLCCAATQDSAYYMCKLCAPLLRASPHASVINVSSLAGTACGHVSSGETHRALLTWRHGDGYGWHVRRAACRPHRGANTAIQSGGGECYRLWMLTGLQT